MGLARALSDEVLPDPDREHQPQLTSEGVVLGTPDYMAPEQARDARNADIRADIYSLGCVLYHLLDGKPPFPDTNIISQMIRHATEMPRPLKEVNPAVPDGLQQMVNWMLAKDPAQRYPTPERAAQALQMFLASGVEPPPTPESDPKMKKYMTFLEVDTVESEKRAKAAAMAPATVVTAAQQKSPGQSDRQRAKAAAARKRERKKARKSKSGLHLPQIKPRDRVPTATPVEAAVDVELVALPAPVVAPPQKMLSLPLTRRDVVMAGIGAATVVTGALIGVLVAKFVGVFEKPETSEDENKPEE
jgi:serine/threonine protein kinase